MIEQIRQMTPGVAVSVGTSPTRVLDRRNRRWEAILQNTHASTAVKVGSGAQLAGGGGITLAAGEIYRHQGRGDLWAVAASGSVTVGAVEVLGPGNMRTHTREYAMEVTSARTLVLIKNFARMHAVIENTHGTHPITIGVGRIFVGSGGIVLKAGQQIDLFGGMEVWAVAGGTNAVQTVAVGGSPTGGTYALRYGNDLSAPLAHNAGATAIRDALEDLPGIGAGNVTVTGTGPFTVTFVNELGARPVEPLLAEAVALTGGTDPDVETVVATLGSSHAVPIAVREEGRR